MANIGDLAKTWQSPETPRFQMLDLKNIRSVVAENVEANYASEFHQRLIAWISAFDESLDQEHEVGVRLVSFGQSIVFHLDAMGYSNPSLISFKGTTTDDDPVELIQHVSQISILLMKLPRKDPSTPKRRIGFCVEPQPPMPE